MKILPREGHLLRLWFPTKESLLIFKEKYLEGIKSITKVDTFSEEYLHNDEKGFIFVVDKID